MGVAIACSLENGVADRADMLEGCLADLHVLGAGHQGSRQEEVNRHVSNGGPD